MRYRTDYILGTDSSIFRNVSVRDPWHNLDHYMVLGCLTSAALMEHKWYLGGQKKLPLRTPTEPMREDDTFAALRMAVRTARPREVRRNNWISTEMWRLVNERVSARQDPAKGQALKRRLGCAISASLAED